MRSIRPLWNYLKDFISPETSGGLSGIHYAILCAFLALVVVLQSYGGAVEGSLSGFWSNGKYAPEPAVLHISGVQWIVHSRFDWDSGLLNSTAVDDVDYGLGAGRSVPARLPGASWATYRYVGAGYIPGSGYYITFQAPGGGRFAMLHLQWLKWYPTMHGGQQVGVTGWPTDPVYAGGGPAGPADAHYCLSFDARGLQWFLHGIYHRPFPLKKWNAWRSGHHKPLVPYQRNGKLRTAARLWLKHRDRARGVVSIHAHAPRGQTPYTEARFAHGTLYFWSAKPSYAPKWIWSR